MNQRKQQTSKTQLFAVYKRLTLDSSAQSTHKLNVKREKKIFHANVIKREQKWLYLYQMR